MQTLIRYILTLCFAFALAAHAAPEAEAMQDDYASPTCVQLDNFLHELSPHRDLIQTQGDRQLRLLRNRLKMFESRFTTFASNNQSAIDEDPEAAERRVAVETLLQELIADIDTRLTNLEKLQALYKAEEYIPRQIPLYKSMHNKALRLAMAEQLASRLQKLKAEEATLKADIDAVFNEARAAVNSNPDFKQHLVKVEEDYYLICSYSSDIQQAAYKPLIERIKDYLLGLAATAIILMFVSMIIARYKTFKTAKKAANDARKALSQQQQYPQI